MKKYFFQLCIIFYILLSCSSESNNDNNIVTLPVTPTNLSGNQDWISPPQINLSWTDNSTNETGFKIERKSSFSNYSVIGTVNQNLMTYTDYSITSNTTYTYRVFAFNEDGNSPTYSNEFTITTSPLIAGPNMNDIDGTIYQSVTICNNTWTKTNLNVSKYADGTIIPQVQDSNSWKNLTTGAWCYYNNSTTDGETYGKLYNWYAVAGIYDSASAANPSLRKKLAPTGWHIPSDPEWTLLTDCLGGESVAGGKMKTPGNSQDNTGLWNTPNTGANNESGFTSLPGGFRSAIDGSYNLRSGVSRWWSSTDVNGTLAWNLGVGYSSSNTSRISQNKCYGYYIRCIKD